MVDVNLLISTALAGTALAGSAAVAPAFAVFALDGESPSSSPALDPTVVTPGPAGFAVFIFLAVAVGFLLWDMIRRIRRAKYLEEIDEKLDAEEEERGDTPQ